MKQKPPRFLRGGFIAMAEIVDLGPRSALGVARISYLLATICGAALFTSNCALTFWICAACSL
ncbi:MAG: hypothetical protein WA269_09270, partial [Candidatus Udaeobacter sp.]